MHTGAQMKYVSKLTDARRTRREDGSSLLYCTSHERRRKRQKQQRLPLRFRTDLMMK